MYWYLDNEKENDSDKMPSILMKRLLDSRIIFITGQVTMKMAREVSIQLLLLEADNDKDIYIYVNSPGGHVEAGDTIYDMIRFIKPTVKTIGTGWVASAAVTIYLGAEKENRYCLPNTRFLIHQPSGGVMGPASDIQIEALEIVKIRERINKLIAERTGQSVEKVTQDTERNFWMGPKEAEKYGLVFNIISNSEELKGSSQ